MRLEPRPPTGAPLWLRPIREPGLRRAESEPAPHAEEGSRPRAALGPAARSESDRELSVPGTAQEILVSFAFEGAVAFGLHAY
jgi:hypothetical protein